MMEAADLGERPSLPRRVQKHKRVAKPLMVALFIMMIDELGDGPARGVLEFVCIFGHDAK